MRHSLLSSFFLVALSSAWFSAHAQTVRILIGFPPGGALDSAARILAENLTEQLKRPVIVEQRLGSGGLQGVLALRAAAPDGNTLMIAPGSTTVLRPLTMKKPAFDTFTDMTPVAMVGQAALALAVHSGVPAKNLREFASWGKANPNTSFFSTGGAGGQTHFFGLMIADAIGMPIRHVPYKGTGPAISDTAGGHVPSTVQPLGALLPQAKAGNLRIIGVSGQRSPAAPDAPTFAEQGFPALSIFAWYAIYGPPAMPPAVLERMNSAIRQSLRVESVRERLRALDLSIPEMSTAELAAYVKQDHDRWIPIIKASGFSEDSD